MSQNNQIPALMSQDNQILLTDRKTQPQALLAEDAALMASAQQPIQHPSASSPSPGRAQLPQQPSAHRTKAQIHVLILTPVYPGSGKAL